MQLSGDTFCSISLISPPQFHMQHSKFVREESFSFTKWTSRMTFEAVRRRPFSEPSKRSLQKHSAAQVSGRISVYT